MTSQPSGVPMSVLREALRRHVDASSLRKVAKALDLSPTGLRGILDGSEPYAPSRQRIERWYLTAEAGAGIPSADVVQAAFRALFYGVRPERQTYLRSVVLDLLRAEWQRAGIEPPAWADVRGKRASGD